MICSNCGKDIDVEKVICPHCGVTTKLFNSVYNYHYNRIINTTPLEKQTNVLAIVGFILSFFVSIAGLVCSVIGYNKSDELNGSGKAFSIAGMLISIAMIIATIALLFWLL